MKSTRIWLLALVSSTLLAQNDFHGNVNLQFRFANPGARAQAMGGAFVGLADDTTAIFANPGGIAQIRATTAVLEGNHLRRDNPIPFYAGRITQTDLQDFRFDLESRNFATSTNSVPFAGYVNPKGRLKWGVFYATQIDYERGFDTGGIAIPLFPGGRYVSVNQLEFFPPSINTVSVQMRTLGGTFAGKVSEHLSLGMTIGYNQLDYEGSGIFNFPNLELLFPDVRFSARDLAALRPLYGMTFSEVGMAGDDQQLSAFAGMLYAPTERFSCGLAYKYQPSFDYDYTRRIRDSDFEWLPQDSGQAEFSVPDSYSAGLSFKPSDFFTLSVEVNRILYSELSDDLLVFFPDPNDPIAASQSAPDVTEYRAGAEYVLASGTYPVAFRLGYWHDPYHAMQNDVLDTQLLYRYLNENGTQVQSPRATAFLHRFAQDLNHLTFGLGVTVGDVIVDLSADIDDLDESYSLSSIYRFR